MRVFLQRRALLAFASGFLLFIAVLPAIAQTDDLRSDSQHLSDSAFALLNSLTSDSTKASATEVTGAMASFAGDAQSLTGALAKGDHDAAGVAMTALVADDRAVDEAMAKNPGAIDSSKWKALRAELAAIQSRVPMASSGAASKSPPGSRSDVVKPPAGETAASAADGSAPRAEITSRETDESGLHIKGFVQGTNLKSAGIYDADTLVYKIDLAPVPGAQRVLLDVKLEQVSPTETIRVEDAGGRTAEVGIADSATAGVRSGGHEKTIELGGSGGSTGGPPDELASRGPDNTAEIPSKSSSRRHLHANGSLAPLSDVQINTLAVQQSMSAANGFEVIGQIVGGNVHRAGIYVDGRLVTPIAVSSGSDTSFNVTFTMLGNEASIRAYGVGNNYVESSLDLSTASGGVYGANPPVGVYSYPVNPYARNPYGYPANPNGYPANPYGAGQCPSGYGLTPSGCQPLRSSRPWWSKIF